jgi:hypothetical protein
MAKVSPTNEQIVRLLEAIQKQQQQIANDVSRLLKR